MLVISKRLVEAQMGGVVVVLGGLEDVAVRHHGGEQAVVPLFLVGSPTRSPIAVLDQKTL